MKTATVSKNFKEATIQFLPLLHHFKYSYSLILILALGFGFGGFGLGGQAGSQASKTNPFGVAQGFGASTTTSMYLFNIIFVVILQ